MLKDILNAIGVSTPKDKPAAMRDDGRHNLRSSNSTRPGSVTADHDKTTNKEAQHAASQAFETRSRSIQSQVKTSSRMVLPALPRTPIKKNGDVEMAEDTESEDGGSRVSMKIPWSDAEAAQILDQNEELRKELSSVGKQLNEARNKLQGHQGSYASKLSTLEDQLHEEQTRSSAQRSQILSLTRQVRRGTQDLEGVQSDLAREKHNALVNENAHRNKGQQVEEQLCKSQEKNKNLAAALEECKDRLFDTQPYQSLTDDGISNLYTIFSQAVEDWVLFDIPSESNTLKLLRRSNAGAKLVAKCMADSEVDLSKRFPRIDGLMLVAMFFRYVYHFFLAPGVMEAGLGESEQIILDNVMDGLSKVVPPKGKSFLW